MESSALDETISTSISMTGLDRMDATGKVSDSSDEQESDSDYAMSMDCEEGASEGPSSSFDPPRSTIHLVPQLPTQIAIQPIQPFSFVIQTKDGPRTIDLKANSDETLSSSHCEVPPAQSSSSALKSISHNELVSIPPTENVVKSQTSSQDAILNDPTLSAPLALPVSAGLESQVISHDPYAKSELQPSLSASGSHIQLEESNPNLMTIPSFDLTHLESSAVSRSTQEDQMSSETEDSDSFEQDVPRTPAMMAPPITPHVPNSTQFSHNPLFQKPLSLTVPQQSRSSVALIDIGVSDDSSSSDSADSSSQYSASESSSSVDSEEEEEVIEEEVPEMASGAAILNFDRAPSDVNSHAISGDIEVINPSGQDEKVEGREQVETQGSMPPGPRLKHSRRGTMLMAPSSPALPRQQILAGDSSATLTPPLDSPSSPVPLSPQYLMRPSASDVYNPVLHASNSFVTNNTMATSPSAPTLQTVSTRVPLTYNHHLRMNVPSQATLITHDLFRRKTTQRMSVMHNSFSVAEFSPLSSTERLQKPQYGPLIQPPLQSVLPWQLPEGMPYQFLYTHPMDESPGDDGSFPEEGKFLVDLDMPAVGARLTTMCLAPRATLLSNRGLKFLLPTLTALDLSYNTIVTGACFEFLPPSLLYLDLRSITEVTDGQLADLPRALQYLNLRSASYITNSDLNHLPKTLTHLTLSGEHPNFTCSAFAKLPRHLKTLRIAGLTKVTKAAAEDLPSTLQRLELPKLVAMRDKCITRLPRSLTHLHIGTVSTAAAASLIHLPPKLQYLNILCMFLNSELDLQLLPSTLQTLHVTCTAFAFSSEGHFTNLTVLNIVGVINETIALPSTITALKYCTNMPPTSSEAFVKLLPLKLKFLVARGFPWADDTVAKLPAGLVWMSLDASQLTSNCFASFPRQLEYIRLQAMRLFRPEALQYLPPTTKYLHLDPHLHNKMLMKHCPIYLPQWAGNCDLATLEDTLFGREYEIMDEKQVFDDPNLWTAMGQRELDSQGWVLNPLDNSVIHGAGYLFPIEHMSVPNTWGPTKFKVKSCKKATPDNFDPAQPSMAPLDIHLAARTATRRSLLPLPSESVRRFEADIMDSDLAALDPTTTDLSAPGARSVSSVGIKQMPSELCYIDMRNLINLTSSKDLGRLFKGRSQLTTLNFESNIFTGTSGLKRKLPKTLVALDLSNSTLSDDLVERLPHSMTYLSLGCTKVSAKFPPSLTALYLGNLHRVEGAFIAKLPRTLVYLDLYSAMEVEEAAIDALPKHSLRYLNLHNLRLLSESCFSRFPRHLKYLSISQVRGITDKGIEALPRSLNHLDISSAQLTAQGIAALPSRLTHLSVAIDHGHDRLECIAYLPRSLTILNYAGDLYDSWVDFLPPFLVFLNLPFAVSMNSMFVKRLPKNLLYLGVHSWARQLLGFPFSCDSLLYLDVYNADISQTPLEAIPQSIQYICSNSTAFKNECAKQLPNFDAAEVGGAALLQTIFHDVELDS
jgi:hypothetical protein